MALSSDQSYLAKKGASDMEADKFSRRVRNVEWAREYLRRAVHRGDTRRAFRAAALIERLENWLDFHAPFVVATYRDF